MTPALPKNFSCSQQTADQKLWTQRLGKKIQKCGYKANSGVGGSKVSPRRLHELFIKSD
jgi:hypothetical protein